MDTEAIPRPISFVTSYSARVITAALLPLGTTPRRWSLRFDESANDSGNGSDYMNWNSTYSENRMA
jgi:hypothetical protein